MAEEPQQITKEQQQITKEPQQITKEPQQVTTKNPKKVEAGKRLAESNHKKREAKKQAKLEASRVNQYYGIGAVLALVVLVITFIGLRKESNQNKIKSHPQPQTNKFEMD